MTLKSIEFHTRVPLGYSTIDLKVIGSTHGGRALWENPLRIAKPKKRQAHRDKALREVKRGGLGPDS
jgi:hypothetical protein